MIDMLFKNLLLFEQYFDRMKLDFFFSAVQIKSLFSDRYYILYNLGVVP